ncbi:MAG: HD domain-containing protein [Candidatus Aenigmarchaeota archaeon]|nr:HD domain-containing protein [Candidatus Aenigmarchaeota archaeon]
MNEKIRKKIEDYVKSLRWTPEDFYWKHAFQVRKFALMIQEKVGGDKDVVEVSALLHDIGKVELLVPGHEEISAKLAKEFLEKIGFDKNKISRIVECIKYENFELIESRILRSADSMALIMDKKGQKWYFENILKNDKNRILKELDKSYSEIDFEFAMEFIKKEYKKLKKEIMLSL